MSGGTKITEKELDILVGARLKALRIASGLSQSELGRSAGISFQQIQKCESGSNRIGAGRLWLFCKILGASPDQFLGGLETELGVGAEHDAPISEEWVKLLSSQNYRLLKLYSEIEDPLYKTSLLRICEGLAEREK